MTEDTKAIQEKADNKGRGAWVAIGLFLVFLYGFRNQIFFKEEYLADQRMNVSDALHTLDFNTASFQTVLANNCDILTADMFVDEYGIKYAYKLGASFSLAILFHHGICVEKNEAAAKAFVRGALARSVRELYVTVHPDHEYPIYLDWHPEQAINFDDGVLAKMYSREELAIRLLYHWPLGVDPVRSEITNWPAEKRSLDTDYKDIKTLPPEMYEMAEWLAERFLGDYDRMKEAAQEIRDGALMLKDEEYEKWIAYDWLQFVRLSQLKWDDSQRGAEADALPES